MKLKVFNQTGSNIGEENFSDKVFAESNNDTLVYLASKKYLAAQRQGTHSALTRAEVSGGGKKPWKQKGTGRARAGSIRSPLWRHGGVIFAPKPRNYDLGLPKKAEKKSIRVLLSDRAKEGKVIVIDSIIIEKPSTKEMTSFLKALKIEGAKVLFVLNPYNRKVYLSGRNIKHLNIKESANAYDILNSEYVVMTRDAAKKFEEIL
ncbi:MAG: large subunit ribosomal protein L4 [Candidatus Saganbacteria bacterium]|uniref:Large ribosomal subunit protein uL4 n=1 Tax=Candidatus Saganbacteria bacterium TaxID=2575572 RepID=A0A833L181_UNCSA|nr:MAG: large subunit ribosomal protein L4 [Candidatus Saganbacteria bacterium]